MIIYFTGCGNSGIAARRIGERLGDKNIVRLTAPVMRESSLATADERVIWVCPVYSWGLPPVVADYIKRVDLDAPADCLHYLALTCGDDAGLTASQWRKLISRRGWTAMAAWTIIMPNVYTLMKGFDVDPVDVEKRKLRQSIARIGHFAEAVEAQSSVDNVIKGKFAWIKSKIIYPWFKRYAMSPKPFHATDACIGCGKCAATCPMENITMTPRAAAAQGSEGVGSRPSWGDNCALCLGCYHVCPTHAVAYGTATAHKGQYKTGLSNC